MTVSTYVINTDGSLSKQLTQMHGGHNKRGTERREREEWKQGVQGESGEHHVSTGRVTCAGTNEGNEGERKSDNSE